jgi:hypothetical protein
MTTEAKQARLDRINEQCKRARDAHYDAVDWALSVGFTEREAPFAAQAAQILKMAKHGRGEVRASEVRARLEYDYPWLFSVNGEGE